MKKAFVSAATIAAALSAGSAFAADLPNRKEPAYIPPPPPPIWTGFYVGLNAGGTFDAGGSDYISTGSVFVDHTVTSPATAAAAAAAGTGLVDTNNGGFIGGGQVGYNYQFGAGGWNAWVVGLEADIQGVAASTSTSNLATGAPFTPFYGIVGTAQVTKSLDYIGTVRGRIGWLGTPTLLLYGTGGLAYGGVNSSTSMVQGITPLLATVTPNAWGGAGSYSDTRVGWTVGGGLEWMFMPNWSAKVEYLYYDLGSATYGGGLTSTFIAATGAPIFLNATATSVRYNGHILHAGLNYHFNWLAPAPVLSKY